MGSHALLTLPLCLFTLLSFGCSPDYGARPRPDRPVQYRYPYPVYPRPYYRPYGPWDLPASRTYPGPPTWYGCPQQSLACFPD